MDSYCCCALHTKWVQLALLLRQSPSQEQSDDVMTDCLAGLWQKYPAEMQHFIYYTYIFCQSSSVVTQSQSFVSHLNTRNGLRWSKRETE